MSFLVPGSIHRRDWNILATPKGGGDPYWNNVIGLYSFDEAAGTRTGFANAKGGTANRESGVSSANFEIKSSPAKFTRSLGIATAAGSSADYSWNQNLGSDVSLGAGNKFTVEGWLYWGGTVDTRVGIGGIWDNALSEIAVIKFYTTNQLNFRTQLGASVDTYINMSSLGALNQWAHIALCYDGTTKYCFVKGALAFSGAVAVGATKSVRYIRSVNTASGGGTPFAYQDELRYTVGVCRYTAPFTPPADPFPRG